MLQHERDQKVRIEKMVEQLARQHSHLEEAAQHALPSAVSTGGHRASRNFIYIILYTSVVLQLAFIAILQVPVMLRKMNVNICLLSMLC